MRVSVLPAKEVTAPPEVETEATMQAKKQAKIVQDIAARASAGAYAQYDNYHAQMRVKTVKYDNM